MERHRRSRFVCVSTGFTGRCTGMSSGERRPVRYPGGVGGGGMDGKPFQRDGGKAASPLQTFASLFLLLKCYAGKSSLSLERRLGNLASFPKAAFT